MAGTPEYEHKTKMGNNHFVNSVKTSGSATIAVPKPKSMEVFECFGLPQELRDLVYGFATKVLDRKSHFSEIKGAEPGYFDDRLGIPVQHFRLVSRGFKAQYDAQSATNPNLTLTVSDVCTVPKHLGHGIPFEFQSTTRLELDIRASCMCYFYKGLLPCTLRKSIFRRLGRSAYAFERLPNVQEVVVRFHWKQLPIDADICFHGVCAIAKKFTARLKVLRVVVYRSEAKRAIPMLFGRDLAWQPLSLAAGPAVVMLPSAHSSLEEGKADI